MKPVNWSLDRKGYLIIRGVPRNFQRGGFTLCQSEGYSPDCRYGQNIVMALSPPVVGCSVKKGLQKGGSSRAPQDPPLATPLLIIAFIVILFFISNNFGQGRAGKVSPFLGRQLSTFHIFFFLADNILRILMSVIAYSSVMFHLSRLKYCFWSLESFKLSSW